MSVSRDDVLHYYQAAWRPDLTTIVVTGDITPEKARAVVEKAFGDWKATGAKPDLDLPKIPLSKASRANVPDKSSVQDEVILAETLGLQVADPDRFLLNLGNEVLGGGCSPPGCIGICGLKPGMSIRSGAALTGAGPVAAIPLNMGQTRIK